MLVVKLELWPGGDESRKRDLGSAHIVNDGDATEKDYRLGDYIVTLFKGAEYSSRPGTVYKRGRVINFPRMSKLAGPWELLALALQEVLGTRINRAKVIGQGLATVSGKKS